MPFNEQIFSQTTPIAWIGKRAPLDEPPCGYDYEKCRNESDNRIRNSQIAAGVLGTIFVAFVIVMLLVYRKWKVEQEIAGLVWKIDPKDVVAFSADGFQDKSTSKVSSSITALSIILPLCLHLVWNPNTLISLSMIVEAKSFILHLFYLFKVHGFHSSTYSVYLAVSISKAPELFNHHLVGI